jgi:DNA-binding NarL/FixJ family response regulator
VRVVLASAGRNHVAMHRTSLLVVDDHIVLGEALVARLGSEPEIDRAAAVGTAREALDLLEAERFDLALVDLNLGADDGLTLCAHLRERHPELCVIMLTCATSPELVVDALRAGASGWIPKDAPVEQLLDALRQVRAGAAWLPSRMLRDVLDELLRDRAAQDRVPELLSRLSGREREVLRELATGQDMGSIARRLYLSQNTVRTHIQNILSKLEVHSRLAAVALVRNDLDQLAPYAIEPGGRRT